MYKNMKIEHKVGLKSGGRIKFDCLSRGLQRQFNIRRIITDWMKTASTLPEHLNFISEMTSRCPPGSPCGLFEMYPEVVHSCEGEGSR